MDTSPQEQIHLHEQEVGNKYFEIIGPKYIMFSLDLSPPAEGLVPIGFIERDKNSGLCFTIGLSYFFFLNYELYFKMSKQLI